MIHAIDVCGKINRAPQKLLRADLLID